MLDKGAHIRLSKCSVVLNNFLMFVAGITNVHAAGLVVTHARLW